MTSYLSRILLGSVLLVSLLIGGPGAAPAQPTPVSKADGKDDAKKKDEAAKKKEAEAKKREEEAKKLAAQVAEQKKIALANWDALAIGEPATRETAHLLLYTPRANARRLADSGPTLDRAYSLAHQALGIKATEPPWPGKLAVYLFPEREQYTTFRRRVEKQKVEPEDTCSYLLGDAPHVAASPPQSSGDVSIDGQASEQLSMAMLKTQCEGFEAPVWLIKGFARATYYRATPGSRITAYERQVVYAMVKDKKANADQVYNNSVAADRASALRGSLAEFMAYGPGTVKFPAFVAGFKPDKEKKQQMRNTRDALKEAAIESDALNKTWHAWVLSGAR